MTAITAALHQAAGLAARRLELLRDRIEAGDEAAWAPYLETAQALAQLAPAVGPGANGKLLSTQELASSMNVSSKTILRRKKAGQLAPAAQLGPRTLRWRTEAGR